MKTFDRDLAVATEEEERKHHIPNGNGRREEETPILTDAEPIPPPPPVSTPPERLSPRELLNALKERKALAGGLAALLLALGIGSFLLLKGKASSPAPSNAAVPVTVQTIVEKPVRLWSEFSGRMQAVNYAEIRPEVSGRITSVRFEDGQTVKKGDVLFVIDPGPYEAALAKAEADAAFTRTEFERADGLLKAQAIAQRLYDERQTAMRVAEAELARARIDVSRAYVKAPITGRVGRPEITVGNLVQSGSNAPLLTSIVSKEGIYADFEVDEQTYLQSIRNNATGQAQERAIPVELTVQGDKTRVYKGSIYSFDNHLDTMSGTIRARAKFANEDGALMPGMFVSIKIGSSGEVPSLLVPERAVGVDQNKKFVYVVGTDNKVGYREVTLGKEISGDRVVLSGLQSGDRVIVDGIQHVHPDVIVQPTEAAAAPPTAPAAVASR
jgi:multidrug efflux system membrane fusion protein